MKTIRTRRLRRAALLAVPVISAAAALLGSGTGAAAPAGVGPVTINYRLGALGFLAHPASPPTETSFAADHHCSFWAAG